MKINPIILFRSLVHPSTTPEATNTNPANSNQLKQTTQILENKWTDFSFNLLDKPGHDTELDKIGGPDFETISESSRQKFNTAVVQFCDKLEKEEGFRKIGQGTTGVVFHKKVGNQDLAFKLTFRESDKRKAGDRQDLIKSEFDELNKIWNKLEVRQKITGYDYKTIQKPIYASKKTLVSNYVPGDEIFANHSMNTATESWRVNEDFLRAQLNPQAIVEYIDFMRFTGKERIDNIDIGKVDNSKFNPQSNAVHVFDFFGTQENEKSKPRLDAKQAEPMVYPLYVLLSHILFFEDQTTFRNTSGHQDRPYGTQIDNKLTELGIDHENFYEDRYQLLLSALKTSLANGHQFEAAGRQDELNKQELIRAITKVKTICSLNDSETRKTFRVRPLTNKAMKILDRLKNDLQSYS